MTKIQEQVLKLLEDTEKDLRDIAAEARCTERALQFWLEGKRVPRDIATIENVVRAMGYELVIQKHEPWQRVVDEDAEDCQWK